MTDSQGNTFGSVLPLLLSTLVFGVVAYSLAKEKGRKVALWTILGCVPVANFFFICFFIGAANLRLERKVDELLGRFGANRSGAAAVGG